MRAAGGLFRWFKPFIIARLWLSLRWPQSPGSGKQFFSKQTTREPRVLAESFPKGFASRLLPGRTAARPGGEGYRHAHVPNARLQTKRRVSGRRLPSHNCHSRPGARRGPGITARQPQSPGVSGNLLLPLSPGTQRHQHGIAPALSPKATLGALTSKTSHSRRSAWLVPGSPATQQRETNGGEAEAGAQGASPRQVRGGWPVRAAEEGPRWPRAYLRSAARGRALPAVDFLERQPFHFPGPANASRSGSSLSRAPPDPSPARAQEMLGSHTARGCSAGTSSSCSWVPTPACHALLGPAGRRALTGMVPSSHTPAPRGPQHYQAFVPKADLTNASEMVQFRDKDLLPRSPGLKTDSLGQPLQVSESRALACYKWSGHTPGTVPVPV